jgi:hypothetical protein
MKFPAWPARYVRTSARAASRAANACVAGASLTAKALLSPIGFREVLLLGGAILLALGASAIYPPAAYLAPGVVLVGVAVFGVRA